MHSHVHTHSYSMHSCMHKHAHRSVMHNPTNANSWMHTCTHVSTHSHTRFRSSQGTRCFLNTKDWFVALHKEHLRKLDWVTVKMRQVSFSNSGHKPATKSLLIFNHPKHGPSTLAPVAEESQVCHLHTWVSEAQSCGDETRERVVPNITSGAVQLSTATLEAGRVLEFTVLIS